MGGKTRTSFQKGQSGNPAGRPKLVSELRERALKAVEEHVIDAWIHEVESKERPVVGADGEVRRDRKGEPIIVVERGPGWIVCARNLAEYGMGKPIQIFEHGGRDGEPIDVTVRFVRAKKDG